METSLMFDPGGKGTLDIIGQIRELIDKSFSSVLV